MKRKTTRLTFTEEELANPNVRRAAKKATRAADRADRAKAKLSPRAPPKRGLKMDTDKAKERSAQLRFGKAEFSEEIAKPKRRKPGAEALLGGEAHRQVDKQNQDENAAYRLPMRGNAWPKVRPKAEGRQVQQETESLQEGRKAGQSRR